MQAISRVAVIGASGNFGKPITTALRRANFDITIITRLNSATEHPDDIAIIRTEYTLADLTNALKGQDAVVCVVGPAGIPLQQIFIDAAEAAGVKRFIIDDFGWGETPASLPEFDAIHKERCIGWDHAKATANANPNFTWTGISTGNPIDWAIKKFPLMGFDVTNHSAIIYDDGTELFTGTTLAGIGEAVVGVLRRPDETANRFVKVLSTMTCQNDLLAAFEEVGGTRWRTQRNTTKALMQAGRAKHQSGTGGWILDLVVAQLFDNGVGRCRIAKSREDSDAELLGVVEESPADVVKKILQAKEKGIDAIY